MKKSFFTGLAILLPIVVTLLIVNFIVNLLTKPFTGAVSSFFHHYGLFQHPFFIWSGPDISVLAAKISVLFLLLFGTLLLGLLGRFFFFTTLVSIGERIIQRIPMVNTIYKSIQDITSSLFKPTSTSFSQVVLVPFPHAKTLSIGLITNDRQKSHEGKNSIAVFVPGTPNPTMGFVFQYQFDQLIYVDMKVEDALKFVMSCGVIYSDFKRK